MVRVVVEPAANNENYEYMHIADCVKNYSKNLTYEHDLLVALVVVVCDVVVVVADVELVVDVVVVEVVELMLVELEAKLILITYLLILKVMIIIPYLLCS